MSVKEVNPQILRADRSSDTAPSGLTARFGPLPWWIAGVAAAFLLVPLLIEYGQQLWGADHYQFYPLLLAAIGWLVWRRSRMPASPFRARASWLRLGLWTVALFVVAGTALASSPFGAAVSLLLLVAAGLYEWRGTSALRQYLPAAAVLLLILRPPFGWDQKLIVAMQRSATAWASGILDLMGIRHLADGVVIRLPQGNFFVDEACSGVHSLFATLAFAAVFAVATQRGLLKSILLLAAAMFWVIAANTLRVLAVVVLSTRYDLPVVEGLGHEILGVAIFALVIGLVLSTDRLLLFLFPQPLGEWSQSIDAASDAAIAADRSVAMRRSFLPVAIAVALVVVAVGVHVMPAQASSPRSPFASSQGLSPVPREALPAEWKEWKQVGFQIRERGKDDPAGQLSRIWTYQKGRLAAAISIDGPFDAWHDTEVCYQGLGYTTQSREDITVPGADTVPAEYTELSITSGSGRHGYVLFMAYSTTGQALRPPASRNASIARLVSAWRQRMAGEPAEALPEGRVFQVQLFTENSLNLTAAEREELTGLFHDMRRIIARASAPAEPHDGAAGDTT